MNIDAKTLAAIATVVGGVLGFLLRWALPPGRAVVDVEVDRLAREYQEALVEVEKAKKTPGKDDDERAFAVATARHNALSKARLLKAALDAVPLA